MHWLFTHVPMSNQYLNGISHGKSQPQPRAEITAANVQSYVTAELSLQLYGPVSTKVQAERVAACTGCELRMQSDSAPDPVGYCKGCGCGVNPRSRLSVKTTMPEASCPQGKWGTAPAQHRNMLKRARAWLLKKLMPKP